MFSVESLSRQNCEYREATQTRIPSLDEKKRLAEDENDAGKLDLHGC